MRRLIVLSLLILAGNAIVQAAVTRTELPNGLMLYQETAPTGANLCDLIAFVHVGSDDESRSQAGISHLLEHTVFKTKSPDGQPLLEQLETSFGSEANGWTSNDYTCYGMHNIAPEQLGEAMEILAQALLQPRYPSSREFAMERRVVCEEIGMRQPDEELLATSSRNHWTKLYELFVPEPRNVTWDAGGFDRVVAGLTLHQVARYQAKHYRPETIEVVVGSTSPESVIQAMTASTFGRFAGSGRHVTDRPILTEAPKRFSIRFSPNSSSDEIGLMIGFLTPDAEPLELFKVQMLKNLLKERVRRSPDRRFSIKTDMDSFGRGPGRQLLLLRGDLNTRYSLGLKSFPALEKAMTELFGSLVLVPATAAELELLKYRFKLELATDNPADRLAKALMYGSTETFEKEAAWLEALTVDDLSSTARKLIDWDHSGIVAHGEGLNLFELRSIVNITLVIACAILPALLISGLHASLSRWLEDGWAVLYLVRPVSRVTILLLRSGAFLLFSLIVLLLTVLFLQLCFVISGGQPGWELWELLPYLILVQAGALIIHIGLMASLQRSLPALLVSLIFLASGNFSLNLLDWIHSLGEMPYLQSFLSLFYAIVPKYDQIRMLGLHSVLGVELQNVTYAALGHFLLLTALAGIWAVIAFSRREFL